MQTGIVFNFQKCSIHDGPGIRTTVFLKGCPLRCLWCSNPESQNPQREISSFFNRCIGCGECLKACPQNAIYAEDDKFKIHYDLCDNCGVCVESCYPGSKQYVGDVLDVDSVMKEIRKDKGFYDRSGGGVTFSGGEPLLQGAFLSEILGECKKAGIHTAVETTGYTDIENLLRAAADLDLIYYDIKHMDSDIHKKLTGVPNEKILENLERLDRERPNIIIRIPVIPGYNDSVSNIKATVEFCCRLDSVKRIELLPYHNYGGNKYKCLNRVYPLQDLQPPDSAVMDALLKEAKSAAEGRGIKIALQES